MSNGSGGGIAVLMGNPDFTIRNTEITGNSAAPRREAPFQKWHNLDKNGIVSPESKIFLTQSA